MPLEDLQSIDNVDDRREILHLLSKLDPDTRVKFLYWARDETNAQVQQRQDPTDETRLLKFVEITISTGDHHEAWFDLCLMIATYGLNKRIALAELERWAARARLLPR